MKTLMDLLGVSWKGHKNGGDIRKTAKYDGITTETNSRAIGHFWRRKLELLNKALLRGPSTENGDCIKHT